MTTLLITIVVLVIIFALLWYAIGIIPFPPPLAGIRWVLYLLLILVAVMVLLTFIPGFHLPR